jgi:hypothetical protein
VATSSSAALRSALGAQFDAEEAEEEENELYQRLSLESEFSASSSGSAAAAAAALQEAGSAGSRRLRQGASANVLLASLFRGGPQAAAAVPAGNELQLLHALVAETDMLGGSISVLD